MVRQIVPALGTALLANVPKCKGVGTRENTTRAAYRCSCSQATRCSMAGPIHDARIASTVLIGRK
jgi:hypothetical protein